MIKDKLIKTKCQPFPIPEKWVRKINERNYSFFKTYLQHLPPQILNEMYQHAIRKFNDELTDCATLKDDSFYKSSTWKKLRVRVLNHYGRKCEICGATSKDTKLHVDHKRPRWIYPELAMEFDNLRVLCETCNLGKGARVPHAKQVWRRIVLTKINKKLSGTL